MYADYYSGPRQTLVFFSVVDLVRVSLSFNCGVTTSFFNFNRSLEPASESSKVDRVCDALRLTLETAGHNKYVKTEYHRKKG